MKTSLRTACEANLDIAVVQQHALSLLKFSPTAKFGMKAAIEVQINAQRFDARPSSMASKMASKRLALALTLLK